MQRKKLNYIILVTIPFIFFLLLMIFFDNFNIKIDYAKITHNLSYNTIFKL